MPATVRRNRILGPKHLVIPDLQVAPGTPTEHIEWAARYAAEKEPNVIVQLGDWGDMPSLSEWDGDGTLAAEGLSIEEDVKAVRDSVGLFERELRKHSRRSYRPHKHIVFGNHDGARVTRYLNANPRERGRLSTKHYGFEGHGWQTHKFLQPTLIHGICYAHYFTVNAQGRETNNKHGQPSAVAQARRMMRTCTAGHRQGLDQAIVHTPTHSIRGLIAGSFYRHDMGYVSSQGQNVWQGIIMCHDIDVRTGFYSIMEVDLRFLERRFS